MLSRVELELRWRGRVHQSLAHYHQARDRANAVFRASLGGEYESPDGTVARQQARHAERRALTEYTRVLRIFTELVLRQGTPPPE